MQQRFLLQILLLAQHVSGTTMPIIRSSRVSYSGCCLWYFVLWFSSCWSGVEMRVMCLVCRMRHCNSCGLWPAQLSLSILCRKVFTECLCQRHVNPPTWRTNDLERSNSRHQVSLKRRERTPAAEGGTMGEKFPRILPKVATSTSILGSFTCRKFRTWDGRLRIFSPEKSDGFGRV